MPRRFEPSENPVRSRAKRLRTDMSEPERLFWFLLRDRRFSGFKFRRQRPIGRFVVDFVCLEKMLVVELDGSQHAEQEQKAFDAARTVYLEAHGYRVHRIWAGHLYSYREGALDGLWRALTSSPPGEKVASRSDDG